MGEETLSGLSYGSNQVKLIRHYQVNSIIGEVLSTVEMCGLTEKQEEALKQSLKRTIWKLWNDDYSFTLPSDLEKEVYEKIEEYRLKQVPLPEIGKAS